VDVYNLILERGYIGALDYANKIEHKNLRLASEIDEIVSELFKIASGVKSIRTAQTAMPRFKSYTMPTAPVRSPQQSSIPSSPSDFTSKKPDEMPRPAGVGDAVGFFAKISYLLRFFLKEKYPRAFEHFMNWLTRSRGALSASSIDSILKQLKNIKDLDEKTLKAIETALNSLKAPAAGAGAVTKDAAGVVNILEKLAGKFKWLEPITTFIGKSAKFLGPIALAFDAYDIFTDFENEGASAKLVCKVVSALLGLGSLFGGPAAPILAGLWLAGSLGCGLIPGGKKEQNSYQSLTQSDINREESSVQLSDLSQSDQNTVKKVFMNNKNKEDLLQNVRNLRSTKVFEDPLKALALIQKHLRQNPGQIVPIN